MSNKKKLSKEEKIEKAKKLMAELDSLELSEKDLRAIAGGGSACPYGVPPYSVM